MGLITRIKRQFHLATTMPATKTTITTQDVIQHLNTDILTMAIDDISEELMATSTHDPGFKALEEVHDLLVRELATRGRWDMESA